MSNSSLRILPGLLVTIAAALITRSICAQIAIPTPTPVITFTEHSDNNLTAVYTNGSGTKTKLSVTGSGDLWFVSTPTLVSTGFAAWFEPSSSLEINFIQPSGTGLGFDVFSDRSTRGVVAMSNDTMTSLPIATDLSNPTAPVSVFGIFNDLGDIASTVPDTGMTATLLGFSLAGLAFLRRKLG